MKTILRPKYLFPKLEYGQILLLLIVFSACSRNTDIPRPSKVTQIQFKENLLTVAIGRTVEPELRHFPSDLNSPDYEWAVSDVTIARVENGIVYGLKAGETEISAVARKLGLTAKMKIRVVPVLPQLLRLQAEKTSLIPGEEIQVTYTVDPPDVTDADKLEIQWSSSDETVCKVSEGKALAVGAGTADLIAQIKGTAVKGSLQIQVAPVPVESVSLNVMQVAVPVGKGARLVSRILPVTATDQRLRWSSDDPLVATVVDGIVLGIKEGTTTIRVTTVDGGKMATCRVTVSPVPVERIILPVTNLTLAVGQSYTTEAIVLPKEAKDKSLKWKSSNARVATVDQLGKVMAVGKGTAIIAAISMSNPKIQTAFQILVLNPQEMIFTQVSSTSKVSIDGYVSATLSGLMENGYSVPVQLISFEVLSHTGEVVAGNYQAAVISPSMQFRHTVAIKNVYQPFVKYVFELNGRRYERRNEIL
ncbi:Ig-like domain-containing protein [Pedobacter steynii]